MWIACQLAGVELRHLHRPGGAGAAAYRTQLRSSREQQSRQLERALRLVGEAERLGRQRLQLPHVSGVCVEGSSVDLPRSRLAASATAKR